MSEALVLVVLIWAALLAPSALRSRNASPHATVGGFERAMDVLRNESRGGAGSRRILVPDDAGRIVARPAGAATSPVPARAHDEDPVVARRLVWFVRCLAASAITLLVGAVAGGWLWLPFVLSASVSLGYMALLRHLKLQRDQARGVVRDLELGAEDAEHTIDLAVGSGDWVGSGTVRLRRWDS